jgi:hypothetical protein
MCVSTFVTVDCSCRGGTILPCARELDALLVDGVIVMVAS